MAIKIANAPARIKCPAIFYMPNEEGGYAEFKFHCFFRPLSTNEREKISAEYLTGKGDDWLLDKVMVDWDGMTDENDQAVPYSHENRRDAGVQFAGLSMAMACCFFDHALPNQREAAAKNSKPLSASNTGEAAGATEQSASPKV